MTGARKVFPVTLSAELFLLAAVALVYLWRAVEQTLVGDALILMAIGLVLVHMLGLGDIVTTVVACGACAGWCVRNRIRERRTA